jgi:REP element-mobilizing transposase RayT
MDKDAIVHRRKLPHVDVEGKPTFITACLEGSLPAIGLKRIRDYREELASRSIPKDMAEADWELKKHKLVFKLVDSLLDGECPVTHLKDDRSAKIIRDAFLRFANERYRLYAYVVMPSHHHWVFLPDDDWATELALRESAKQRPKTPREVISHSVQSFTGTMCNRVLDKTGSFWQTETFDHYCRDEAELFRIIDYIEQNPVVAGLVKQPEDYCWSSAYQRKQLKLPVGAPIPKPVG